MAIFGGISQAYVTNNAQAKLLALRRALEDVTDFHSWLAAYSSADLVALGFTAADAGAILSAFADASELATLYNGGALGSYTLPYNFSASQRVITGPLT
jgi:hypothetical protein